MQCIHQSLNSGIILVAFLDHQDVHIGRVGVFNGQGVFHGVEAGFQRIVDVDDGDVHLTQGVGDHGGLQLGEGQVLGVLHDVVGSGVQTGVSAELDETLGLQQQQGTGLVGHVVGDSNGSAVSQSVQRGGLAGVDAHGLDVDAGHAHQVGAVLSVEVVQIGDVLEVVGVLGALLHGGVGDHIVAVDVDLQVNALLFQDGNADFQNFGVGSGGSSHVQHGGLCGSLSGGFGLSGLLRRGLLGAAAGGQGQAQHQGQCQSQQFFHCSFPPIFLGFFYFIRLSGIPKTGGETDVTRIYLVWVNRASISRGAKPFLCPLSRRLSMRADTWLKTD